MELQTLVDLTPHNTFGLPAVARTMVHIDSDASILRLLAHPRYGPMSKWVLGGGSNVIFSGDSADLVLKVAIKGRRLLATRPDAWIVEAGAGESWHELVRWTIANGRPGLENLALIPGTVGAAPVQNIGAYGVSLQDRFDELDAIDLATGRLFTLTGDQCRFGYRDSIFKQSLSGRCMITRVRMRLPRPWRPVLDYPDLRRRRRESGTGRPDPQQIFDWVCALRRAKLPDPATVGNAGSFFKNPVVTADRFAQLLRHHPAAVGYRQPDGRVKLAAGWLIETCGWRGRTMGRVGVYAQQALVLVNRGGATGSEVLALARAIQESVKDRFGITLEIEPTVV